MEHLKAVTCMQELMELEAANTKSIEEVIEEERRQVEAKTPITEEVPAPCQSVARLSAVS